MGTTLTGTTPQDTYDSLIKVTDNGPLSGTAKYLSDGLGNDSKLSLSTSEVGIGTAAPEQLLTVAGGNFTVSGNTAAARQILLLTTNSTVALVEASYQGVSTFGDLAFRTSATERVRITSAGNVGIGTSSPTQKLSVVNGSIFTSRTDSSENIIISDGTTNSSIQQVTHLYLNSGGNSATFGDVIFRTKNSYTEMARFTSNGLCFNGDTAAANALDDYEEGTFTPTASSGITINEVTKATYTKIGNIVTFQVWLKVDITSANFIIAGLPVTISDRTTCSVSDISSIEVIANQLVASNSIYGYGATTGTDINLFLGGNYRAA